MPGLVLTINRTQNSDSSRLESSVVREADESASSWERTSASACAAEADGVSDDPRFSPFGWSRPTSCVDNIPSRHSAIPLRNALLLVEPVHVLLARGPSLSKACRVGRLGLRSGRCAAPDAVVAAPLLAVVGHLRLSVDDRLDPLEVFVPAHFLLLGSVYFRA